MRAHDCHAAGHDARRALLGVSSLEKRVADLQVTETERSRRRRGSVETEGESGTSEVERRLRRQVLAESEVEKRVADLTLGDVAARTARCLAAVTAPGPAIRAAGLGIFYCILSEILWSWVYSFPTILIVAIATALCGEFHFPFGSVNFIFVLMKKF